MGNLLRHGVHDGLRGHDGACNCSFGVDGLAGRIHARTARCLRNGAHLPNTSQDVDPLVAGFMAQNLGQWKGGFAHVSMLAVQWWAARRYSYFE